MGLLGWQDTAGALSRTPLSSAKQQCWAAYRRQQRHQLCQFATRAQNAAARDPAVHHAGQQAAGQLQPPASIQAICSAASAELMRTLEDCLDLGRDDERTTVTALQHASNRLHDPTFAQSPAELDALLLTLERMLRRNLAALTPDQLGAATRAYVVLGGTSHVVIAGLQRCAVNWGAEEYSLHALAELAWSFAHFKRPTAAALQAHLRMAVEDPQCDWRAWFEGASSGQLLMLLWGLAALQAMPCEAFLEAVCWQMTNLTLAGLPSKSLVTLLWALARLRAPDAKESPMLTDTVEAISEELCARMEHQLSEEQLPHKQRSQQAQHAKQAARRGAGVPDQPGREQQAAAQRPRRAGAQGEEAGTRWLEADPGSAPAGKTSMAGGDSWLPQHPPTCEEPPSWGAPAGAAAGAAAVHWDDVGHAVSSEADLSPSMLATLVWAWGMLHHRSRHGLRMATLLLQGVAQDLGPPDTTRALWGLAQLEYSPTQLLAALCSQLMQPGVLASFTARQLATTSYALSALDHFPGEPLLGLLAGRCLAVRGDLDPPSLTHVLWSLARLGYAHEPFYDQLAQQVLGDMAQYSPAELADVSRVYAKLGLAPDGLFEAIAAQMEASLPGADLQDVLRILTAFHQTGLQPEPLLAAVDAWANQRLRQLSPQALALALRTFAQLGGPCSPALLASAEECVVGQLERFEPGQLALVCWSFTKLGYHARGVVDQGLVLLVEATPRFSDKAVSNVLWSLATLCHTLPKRAGQAPLDRVAANLQGRLQGFSAQALSTIAWSYATLGHKPASALLQELGEVARGQLRAFEPQGMALLVWALAALGHSHQPLLSSIDEFCSSRGRLASREPQHLSNLAWGMAKVGFRPSPAFRQQLARDAALSVADMSPQEVFNVGWAFATWRLRPGQLFEALAGEAARRAFSFSSQELAGLLWALARVGHSRGAGVAALRRASEQELDRRGADFSDRHLAMTTWAWGELGHAPGRRGMAALLREVQARAPGLGAQELCTLLKGLVSLRAPFSKELTADLSACALRQAPSMKPSEAAEILEAWLVLGAQQEAAALLQCLAGTPAATCTATAATATAGAARTAAAAADLVHSVAATTSEGRPASSGVAMNEAQGVAAGIAAAPRSSSSGGSGERSSGRQSLLPRPVRLAGRAGASVPRSQQPPSEEAAAAASLGPEAVIASSCQGPSLLDRTIDQGKPPALVRILAAMVHLAVYPEPGFGKLCNLLSAVPPSYKFSAKDLQQLAVATAAMDPSRQLHLRLNKNLLAKAQAAAGAAQPASQASLPPSTAAAKRGHHGGEEREKQQHHGGHAAEL
ncbi:hypothetical protein N2152v2_004705 [Parachlorella kessleri]